MTECRSCGEPIEQNWTHCPNCGTSTESLEQSQLRRVIHQSLSFTDSHIIEILIYAVGISIFLWLFLPYWKQDSVNEFDVRNADTYLLIIFTVTAMTLCLFRRARVLAVVLAVETLLYTTNRLIIDFTISEISELAFASYALGVSVFAGFALIILSLRRHVVRLLLTSSTFRISIATGVLGVVWMIGNSVNSSRIIYTITKGSQTWNENSSKILVRDWGGAFNANAEFFKQSGTITFYILILFLAIVLPLLVPQMYSGIALVGLGIWLFIDSAGLIGALASETIDPLTNGYTQTQIQDLGLMIERTVLPGGWLMLLIPIALMLLGIFISLGSLIDKQE